MGKDDARSRDHKTLEGHARQNVMTLAAGEFIRRFLMHVLPNGFHRIRHYGLFANGRRVENLALCRELLDISSPPKSSDAMGHADQAKAPVEPPPCPCCGGRMMIVETFESAYSRAHRAKGFDSS